MKDSILYILNIVLDIIANLFFAMYIFIGACVVVSFYTAIVFTACFVIIQIAQGFDRYVN